ncbi:dihydroxyacetone kinase phosphoryl donor subunit DhaM [Vibrio hannami]|uniref:dihydroxyacetone kinase phosphoryl donor subunit DhaM n=1 Tax=Vibrio hannami TaxID=2717094 RepID=UPI00240F37B6|nr:dihydroxyacetone kinase phosphoryl donor subunit DhaM [Vibrio hannami]MDG3087852.1 dihydroxyacetone kinase phosphoryl donor subunit DhaM [Vibrio hannami]
MVSLVIVSHSKRLAEGVFELASQMSQGKVKMAIAAGIDDPDNPIGTDPIAVMSAIEEVFTPEGVLVLVDMGSAILNTDMALELIDPDMAESVHVCAAPLIEGTMAAAVSAAGGMPMEEVLKETHSAIFAKYETLEQSDALPVSKGSDELTSEVELDSDHTFSWVIENPNGIHARPASAIVSVATKFVSEMWLIKGDKQVSAKSMNNITLLGVKKEDTITCIARGDDASDAIDAFSELAKNHFGDDIDTETNNVAAVEDKKPEASPENDGSIQGIAVSDGISVAPVKFLNSNGLSFPERIFSSEVEELHRLEAALTQADKELTELVAEILKKASDSEADIFRAHQEMLSDPELRDTVQDSIIAKQIIAEQAWAEEIEEMAQAYRMIPDTYLSERANDICDIGRRVLRLMTGQVVSQVVYDKPVIVAATELYPSDTAQFDPEIIKGICLEKGEPLLTAPLLHVRLVFLL